MSLWNYANVFAAAGFAGNSFDIAVGHNVSYTSTAGDLVFDDTTKTLTLTAGTWPTWIREVGKVFSTNSATNPGPFTVVSVDVTNKILTVLEAVTDETPVGTTVVDGSADTRLIDVLLSVGGAALESNAPHALVSTGALGASRTLDISALEAENALEGGEDLPGRFFYLSVQNTDIAATRTITVNSSSTINGAGTFVISSLGDYLFTHVKDGVWRVNILPRPGENLSTLVRVPFTAANWSAGTPNQIVVIQSGSPTGGQVGPHLLTKYGSYMVQVVNTDLTPDELVNVEVQFDSTTGNVTLVKAQGMKPFSGVAVISGTLD